jgi:flagellar basal-body rod protein FlgB
MIDGLFASANYQGVKKMLDATVLRQEAIASNLANLETPNYKRVDISPGFASQLSTAIGSGSAARIRGIRPTISIDQTAVAQNRDGNSVQLEKEMIYLQRNMVAHHLQTQMLTGTYSKLQTAIRGR